MENRAVHSGHRARLRARLLGGGASALYDHELAELLLYYTARRRNVSEQAHILADGGVAALLNPDAADGCCPPAMAGKYRALCRQLNEFRRLYDADKTDCLIGRRNLNATAGACQYALSLTTGAAEERVWLLCLDNKMGLKNCISMPAERLDGLDFGQAYRLADRCSSSVIMLIYSHLDGVCAFTRAEIDAAARLYKRFSVSGIRLADIILCCDGQAVRFCDTGLLESGADR